MSDTLFIAENETQGVTLVQRVRRADTALARGRGLTFRRRLGAEEGLWFVGRRESRIDAAITMLFVFFPIGVMWLDRQNQVVDKVVARPFRLSYVPQAAAVEWLECQPAVLDQVEIGDRIRFTPRDEGVSP
jgi:uncharacterized membrane protein (UPF0127 family)